MHTGEMIVMKKKNRVTLLNIVSNIVLQITNIITWFIIPKIILSYFGSDVNGLVSSITQFLLYDLYYNFYLHILKK
jgi:K+-sensing histidine kinase KdpD